MKLYHIYLRNGCHLFVDVDDINYATASETENGRYGYLCLWMKDGTKHEICGYYGDHLPTTVEHLLNDIMELKNRNEKKKT